MEWLKLSWSQRVISDRFRYSLSRKLIKVKKINFPLTNDGNLTSEMLGLANRALAKKDNLAKLKLKETISNK